jgi:hypothetical protein
MTRRTKNMCHHLPTTSLHIMKAMVMVLSDNGQAVPYRKMSHNTDHLWWYKVAWAVQTQASHERSIPLSVRSECTAQVSSMAWWGAAIQHFAISFLTSSLSKCDQGTCLLAFVYTEKRCGKQHTQGTRTSHFALLLRENSINLLMAQHLQQWLWCHTGNF